ncbi:MAG: TetR/AcrR family transcriptional regulator [Dokdonella sp.]|nr:MAG: TetR/AcrR family transcriptional regulator [Dokdonella sp.]
MFNAFGEPNVTTNHIADETGISPGNLYYHFRSKGDIVECLFAAYEARIDEALLLPSARAPNIEDLWLQLHLLFEAIGQYRFLHRDLVDILARNRRIRARFARILDRAETSARTLLQQLMADGVLRLGPGELATLVENALALVTFWVGYDSVRNNHFDGAIGDPRAGMRRVIALLEPHLAAAERAHLAALAQAYSG